MSETKWTKTKLLSDQHGFVFRDDTLGTTVALPGDNTTLEERVANGQLFSAAPEMYAALERIQSVWDEREMSNSAIGDRLLDLGIMRDALAAMAKARGESR